MGIIRKKNKVEEPKAPAPPPAAWEEDVEVLDDSNELEQAQAKVKELQQEVEAKKEIDPTPTEPTTNEQARIRQVVLRQDGFFETVIESNYQIGNVGERFE